MKKIYKLFKKDIISKIKQKIKKHYHKSVDSKTFKFEILAYRILKPYFNFLLKKRNAPPQFLFLLCPARSGSTLLAHILSSHPKLTGRFEHHENYNSHNDLNKLIYRTAVLNNNLKVKDQKYFIDKLVWNYSINESILNDSNVKFIFLLREPRENLNSMTTINEDWKDAKNALNYYENRIDYLVRSASLVDDKKRCLLINYEDLVKETDKTLSKLKSFLNTTIPFTENYRTMNNTGNLKYGDPSSTIRSGKIVHKKKPVKNQFTDDTYKKAELVYKKGKKELSKFCTV